jgi:hypothetical protein
MKEEKGKKSVGIIVFDFVLFHVLCSIVYAISCVFTCLPLSSFFCIEKDLLCSLERCFVYYLKIQATESFKISLKSVRMNIVTNILPLFITIFRSFLSRTPRKFQVFCLKKYCCPLRSIGQLSFRTPLHILHFRHPEDHVCICISGDRNEHLLREIVKKSGWVMSLFRS